MKKSCIQQVWELRCHRSKHNLSLHATHYTRSRQPCHLPTGRHQLGVGHSFFKFPKTLQTTSIGNVACRTRDGLDLDVDVQFNWRLDISLGNLLELLYDYGDIDQVNVLYNRIARNVVRYVH